MGSTDRKKRAAARGGKRSRPAAYVPGRTADSRRPPAAAGAPAPRADHLEDGSRHQQEPPEEAGNRPKIAKLQENLQEKAFPCALLTIIPTETDGTAAASCKIGAKMQDSDPVPRRPPPETTTGHASGGGGLQFGKAKEEHRAPQLSSPYPCSFSHFPYGNKHTERRCGKLRAS